MSEYHESGRRLCVSASGGPGQERTLSPQRARCSTLREALQPGHQARDVMREAPRHSMRNTQDTADSGLIEGEGAEGARDRCAWGAWEKP